MKTILITGATSGIGYATSEYLLKMGYRIVMVARNEKKLMENAEQWGENALYYVCDLSQYENIEGIFTYCYDNGIVLDGLVHCAGITSNNAVRSIDIKEMKEMFDINSMAFAELGRIFSKKKYSNDGSSIVVMSSTASYIMAAGVMEYSASKAALNSMVKTMSKEFLRRKIRVNAILPAYVNTPMVDNVRQIIPDIDSKAGELGIIEPIYISYLIEFLLSDKTSYITGALIPMTAGL